MKPRIITQRSIARSWITRCPIAWALVCLPSILFAQGDKDLRVKADALFAQGEYAQAYPMYSQLVSLSPKDFELNYRFGTCTLYGGDDRDKAVGFLKYATTGPACPPLAWYFLGRAYHISYHFKDALDAYNRFKGTADKRTLADHPVDALEQQCRNGQNLLSNLKEIDVHSRLEVDGTDFFRFYDLGSIGGRIVVTPDELMTSLDKKSKERSLIYLPDKSGPIFFSSYGKDGRTGRDIYRTELLPNGKFSDPVKVAGYINTDEDEAFAAMAPDGKSFYFCSKGHNSMGGYDVFKSSYDRGMDVFGAPVNLDFAVNTPDDDMLYVVDAEGKEACFASGRDSKQGMVHVYRVGTTQAPVSITVLKGTYASQFDEKDRKAHITVIDALTQETVSDVRTDMNGEYVLAIPRSGRYRFMVEAGPGGKTHAGMVDVPRSEEPKAYRQEMSLVDQGGEKLMIKNYFDTPLEEDMISLALEEIKRRAKLDVGEHPAVVQAPAEEAPKTDPLGRAGFSSDVSRTDVLRMASDDAQELDHRAKDLAQRSKAGFTLAMQNAAKAEALAKKAGELFTQAQAAPEGTERNTLMTEAARSRQRSRDANLRARAAYKAGEDLERERMTTAQQAAEAGKLSADLERSFQGPDNDQALAQLIALKTRITTKNGPEGGVDATERIRRAATEQDKSAARELQKASSRREEEAELAGRVDRMKREEEAAKGGKRTEIAKNRIQLEEQLGFLRKESEDAFAKARIAEVETRVAHGEASVANYLSQHADDKPVTEMSTDERATLGQRIAGTDGRNDALAIDERYDAAIAAETERANVRTFDWEAPEATETDVAMATRTVDRNDPTDARTANGNTVTMDPGTLAGKEVRDGGTAPNVALTPGDSTALADDTAPNAERVVEHVDPKSTNESNASSGSTPDPVGTTNTTRTASSDSTLPATNGSGQVDPVNERHTSDLASMRGAGTLDTATVRSSEPTLTPEEIRNAEVKPVEPPVAIVEPPTAEEIAFEQANELAELNQLRKAEKQRARRDSLDTRIATLQNEMRATAQEAEAQRAKDASYATDTTTPSRGLTASSPEEAEHIIDSLSASRPALDFAPSINDDLLIGEIFADYAKDRHRIVTNIEDPRERGTSLHGLDLTLVDSIDAESARQLAVIHRQPDQASVVLPRVDRLRQLKETRLREAERTLAESEQQYAANESQRAESDVLEQQRNTAAEAERARPKASVTPHNDSYVELARDPEYVYESTIALRSGKVGDAVSEQNKELEKMVALEDRIDSLEERLTTMPSGRAKDKLRETADRAIDDHMIMRAEMGQRTGYISREEYLAAVDSTRTLRSEVLRKGLPTGEPMEQLAATLEKDAKESMDRASAMRRQADRNENIVVRDSLFRQAYATELNALRELDRSHTVLNYLLSDRYVQGENIAYEEVEKRMFGGADPFASEASKQGSPEGSATNRDTAAVTGVPERKGSDAQAFKERYGSMLANEGGQPVSNEEDASSLAVGAQRAANEARDLEQRSIAVADQANATQDSVATAKRKDRDRLSREALRLRMLSDSLHLASVAMSANADELARKEAAATDKEAFAERLRKYYYLSNEDQAMVMSEEDRSRYFMARSKALEGSAIAEEARSTAKSDSLLAAGLLDQAHLADAAAEKGGPVSTAELLERSRKLNAQAQVLIHRYDSLKAVELRSVRAAGMNDAQAAALMQGAEAQRGTEIMAMEQRARRTEPVLAQARASDGGTSVPEARPEPAVPARTEEPTPASHAHVPEPVVSAPEHVAEAMPEPVRPTPSLSAPVARAPEPGAPTLMSPLAADLFSLATPVTPRSGPIPVDQPMPEGTVFKVQIGAFKHDIPNELFSDMAPVVGESAGNGITRYTAGMFTSPENAAHAAEQVRARGYRDAFVVAYQDGHRVSLAQAVRAVDPHTASQPANATVTRPPAEIRAPSAVPSVDRSVDSALVADQEVLSKYPASAEQVLAQFAPPSDAASYYNDPAAAPARQVETVKGLFFTVQVGVYSKPTALDKLFNITPLNSERTETNKIRYTTGVFADMEKARSRKDQTVGLGVKDAFITAYLNGKRIPMRDARALIAKFGPSVFAEPALLTR